MRKIIFAVAFVIVCFEAVNAQAQEEAQKNAVLNSPYLAKAKVCMNDMVSAGKSAGLETDREGGNILILDPTKEAKLGEILDGTFKCLDDAFAMKKEKIDRRPSAEEVGTRSWVWYASVAGLYIWCASDGDSEPNKVGNLGGRGPKKDWYAIVLECSISDKIKGWYVP
jgi:hypothetical protein